MSDTYTNFDFIKQLDKDQMAMFLKEQIKIFLNTQNLQIDEESEKAINQTYREWLDEHCNVVEMNQNNIEET